MHLKMFAALCVVALFVAGVHSKLQLPPEMQEMMHELEHTCVQESGVDQSELDAAKKFNFPDDPKFKCMVKCMMVKMNALTEEGDLDIDVIEQSMPEEVKKMGAMDIVEKCKNTKGSDLCDTAYQLLLCFYNNGKEIAEFFV